MSTEFVPIRYQPPLPVDRFITHDAPDPEAVPMDVVFVGGGPAGLAGAIRLAQLVRADNERGGGIGDIEIGVLEKAAGLGEHTLSGAVIDPGPFQTLFPDIAIGDMPFRAPVTKERVYLLRERSALQIPVPPTMKNHGNHIASLCEVVRWMGERSEELGINLFTGFPAESLLVDGDSVIGVRTAPAGLDRDGNAGASYQPPTDITARVVALAEGSRGSLAQAFQRWQSIASPNPQIFALGVKEIWETKQPLDAIVHTLGWPLPHDAFGGSFMYPLEPNVIALGLVVGLDYDDANLDVHVLLQRMKQHPLFRPYLENGDMVEWGAKTIPEGGYYSIPDRRTGNGVVVLGDSAGFVEVASLKGVHYAVQSGILAANAIFDALKAGDVSASSLSAYDHRVDESFIVSDLRRRRNMRLAFKSGFYMGGIKSVLMTMTNGAFPGGQIKTEEDAAEPRTATAHTATAHTATAHTATAAHAGAARTTAAPHTATAPHTTRPATTSETTEFVPDGRLTFSKLDAVFKAGNATRDDIPSHLIVGEDVTAEVAEFYTHVCPAGVYERDGDRLIVNAPNCIDCKATDVLGPRWTPREGGSGPSYRRM